MKKRLKFILILFILIFLCSCQRGLSEIDQLIKKPSMAENILQGTWEIISIQKNTIQNDQKHFEIGEKLYINNRLVAINDEFTMYPNFSAKYVNLKDYFEYKGIQQDNLIMTLPKEVVVLNASQGQMYSRDFIKIDDENMVFTNHSIVYFLKKIDSDVDKTVVNLYEEKMHNIKNLYSSDSTGSKEQCLILGVYEREVGNLPDDNNYNYYTYAVRLDSGKNSRVYKAKDIFYPTVQGFWKLKIEKNLITNLDDKIINYPIHLDKKLKEDQKLLSKYMYNESDTNFRINYVKEPFISLEYKKRQNNYRNTEYAILKYTDIAKFKKLNVNEITGTNSFDNFKNVVNSEINRDMDIQQDYKDIDYTNVGIVRDKSLWRFVSSYYLDIGERLRSKTFNIDMSMEGERLNDLKDKLTLDQIKNKFPNAIDYFESPNSQYVLITNSDEILICNLENGYLISSPIRSIPIENPTQIVMCEWAIGEYAPKWEESFIENNELIKD